MMEVADVLFIVTCVLVCLKQTVVTSKVVSREQIFYKNPGFYNTGIFSRDANARLSLIPCAGECLSDVYCDAFSFNSEEMLCSKHCLDRSGNLVANSSWEYYEPKDNSTWGNRTCPRCEVDFQHFNNSCYFFTGERLSWSAANSSCVARGAHLVTMESKEENDFLFQQAKTVWSEFPTLYYWTGGNDLAQAGVWRWASSDGIIGPYSNWAGVESTRVDEHCLILVNDEKWHDATCSDEFGYICEKEITLV